jgi:hypothetical protein
MVWKILSVIGVLCLGGSAYFAYVNGEQIKAEKVLLARAEANLEQIQERKKQGGETKERKDAQLAQTEKDRDETKEEVVKVAADVQEKEAGLALAKNSLDQLTQQVATLDAKIKDAGDIKALVAQVRALEKDQQAAEGELASKQQSLAAAQSKIETLRERIKGFEAIEERVRRGVVEADFTARISGVFDDWGFIVLNKGNNGGAFANALLDVKRGQDVVAKLRIKNVEPNISVADLVKGSLLEGEVLRAGDLVVAAADQPAIATSTVTKSAVDGAEAISTDLPMAGEQPADPFGGPSGMEGGAPATSDPFGGAPAMDGGAPAPATSDPFGGDTPAMDGGAPATSDPFGAAEAPAMDGGSAPAPDSDPFK